VIVTVETPSNVHVSSRLNPETMSRKFFIGAECRAQGSFPFQDWMDVETFLIKLRSLFKDTPGRKELLEFTARITSGTSVDLQDDGVSQQVTVKQGVSGALKASATAPSVVTLAPFRTFREIEQPASEFIFRIKSVGDKVVCALFEADGGAWEIDALKKIDAWLTERLPGVTILA